LQIAQFLGCRAAGGAQPSDGRGHRRRQARPIQTPRQARRRAGPYSLPWCEMRLTALANPTVSSGRPQRAPVTDRCR
jgi:hypothetical protein